MNPRDSFDLNVTTLLALRQETDALRIITERLRVREMGPADHIRTKHEVKEFVESGSVKSAETLLKLAETRRQLNQNEKMQMAAQRGQKLNH